LWPWFLPAAGAGLDGDLAHHEVRRRARQGAVRNSRTTTLAAAATTAVTFDGSFDFKNRR
jgi:hypothetical protein